MDKSSVIITCHNYGRFLSWCIYSVLHQTKAPYEIIVINDSSSDNTEVVAEKFKDSISYYSVSYRNVCLSRNSGLSKASGEYVLFLDADDFLDNYALELMEKELDADSQLKLVYSDQFRFGRPDALPAGRKFIYYDQKSEFDIQKLRYRNYIALPALIRRKEFPGFDPRIKANEDWDAWLSCLKSNEDARRVAVPLFSYRKHGENKTLSELRYIERLKILLKHGIIQLDNNEVNDTGINYVNSKICSLSIIAHNISKDSLKNIISFVESERKCIKALWLVCSNELESKITGDIKKEYSTLPFEVVKAANIDAAMHILSRGKSRYDLATTEALLISDFGSSTSNVDNVSTDTSKPIACISRPDIQTILSAESWKGVGPVLLNRSALRYLYYLRDYMIPDTVIGKFIYKAKRELDKNLLWRLKSKHD